MSSVTNIILCTLFIGEEEKQQRLHEINEWLGINHAPLKELQRECIGGEKYMETDIFIGAFNYIYVDEFITFLKALTWEYETDMFIKTAHADRFTHIKIDGSDAQ